MRLSKNAFLEERDVQTDMPFKDWGDKERMLVNIWVEMSHREGAPATFPLGHGDKFKLLGVMGEYLINQTSSGLEK